MLIAAATLLFLTGVAHSYLGERYILMRLFRLDNLPQLFGGTSFTTGTLRFVWHLTTVAWWGLGYIAIAAGSQSLGPAHALRAVAAVAFVSGVFPLVFTRGRHLSWIVFFVVAALLMLVASGM
ncbi:MAG: hypothetical protein WBQ78_01365 [Gammaproteobacteria bacterium]